MEKDVRSEYEAEEVEKVEDEPILRRVEELAKRLWNEREELGVSSKSKRRDIEGFTFSHLKTMSVSSGERGSTVED